MCYYSRNSTTGFVTLLAEQAWKEKAITLCIIFAGIVGSEAWKKIERGCVT